MSEEVPSPPGEVERGEPTQRGTAERSRRILPGAPNLAKQGLILSMRLQGACEGPLQVKGPSQVEVPLQVIETESNDRMERLNFKGNKRDRILYLKIEKRQKRQFFKNLSTAKSFEIFTELCKFSHSINPNIQFNILDMNKIKTLAKVHKLFGKVG